MSRRPLIALAAAAVLAAGALCAQERKGGERGDLKIVTLQGRVVSVGEEMAQKYGARTAGAGPEKQWVLVGPEGQLYTFLDNEQYRKLLSASLSGKAVEVTARHFPRSMLLEITAFKRIPLETIARRFHCDICNIDFDDYGPCVCCGEEVRPVPK